MFSFIEFSWSSIFLIVLVLEGILNFFKERLKKCVMKSSTARREKRVKSKNQIKWNGPTVNLLEGQYIRCLVRLHLFFV